MAAATGLRAFPAALALLCSGCVHAVYTPPGDFTARSNTAVIEKSYDAAWADLVAHAASEFFAIEGFEKDSGLITLAYAGALATFVDCGHYREVRGRVRFDGPYARWLSLNGGELSGRMNIVARPLDRSNTKVTVNARYVITLRGDLGVPVGLYSFDSNGSDVGPRVDRAEFDDGPRVCRANGAAEEAILSALR